MIYFHETHGLPSEIYLEEINKISKRQLLLKTMEDWRYFSKNLNEKKLKENRKGYTPELKKEFIKQWNYELSNRTE